MTLVTDASGVVHYKGVDGYSNKRLKRVSVEGVYSPEETLDEVRETARKISKATGCALVVYKIGIISDSLPANESVKELSEVVDSIIHQDTVYPYRKAQNNCFDMLKFVDNGCSECTGLSTCQQDHVPKEVLERVSVKQADGWGRNLSFGMSLDTVSAAEPFGVRLVKSSEVSQDFFPKKFPDISEINVSLESIKDKQARVVARNKNAGASRKFGNEQCRNCALNVGHYRNYCSEGGDMYRRRHCSGRVSTEELRDYIKREVKEAWGCIPTWRNKGLHAAFELIGCDALMDQLGSKGHAGSVVRVYPSEDKKQLMVKTIRSWGAYMEQVDTLSRFLKVNPQLKHRLQRDKTRLSSDQALMLAWALACGKFTRNKMFWGQWTEDFQSIEALSDHNGEGILAIRLTNWSTLRFKNIRDVHNPEYSDLWGSLRTPEGRYYKDWEKNW